MRNIINLICLTFLISGCSTSLKSDVQQSALGNILIITSNQHTYGNTDMNTANHFAEIVLAYDILVTAGYHVDFVSPKGGAIPIGYIKTSDSIQKKYVYDAAFMNLLKTTKKATDINPDDYKAVYYSGGGAAMFGVPENISIQNISSQIYANQGVISAVCHGTAGIVHLKAKNGNYIYQGKKVNGFPDLFENKKAAYYQQFPFSIEETINNNGGNFVYSKKGWDSYYTVDERLITGQDPTASKVVAQKIIETLQKTN
ncbi:type 1 glutamine amidotransferase domain-containing protein [Aquimarina celericrescens]|uniref:Type 1 glutamine amidotransferase domain-containing protein n=1 Tax=Aquimarina celericrescens TaxID=1964542 RepID=A0ABW5B0K1_9FLAO|nr:type 1 glutamine amidotransferase domain-containing protein [Aquimarina celericrescens]